MVEAGTVGVGYVVIFFLSLKQTDNSTHILVSNYRVKKSRVPIVYCAVLVVSSFYKTRVGEGRGTCYVCIHKRG